MHNYHGMTRHTNKYINENVLTKYLHLGIRFSLLVLLLLLISLATLVLPDSPVLSNCLFGVSLLDVFVSYNTMNKHV